MPKQMAPRKKPSDFANPKGSSSKQTEGSSSGGGGGGGGSSGIIFNTGFGQHILYNPLVLNSIVQKASILPTDTVLEIGPGTGNLTVRLLEAAKKVIAFEIDPRMVAEIRKRVQGKPYAHKLEIIEGDVIKKELPFFNVCVANTPYAISSPLTFKLLNHMPRPRCCVLMFQKEFCQRMVAVPGSPMYCRLSTNCQLLSKVDIVLNVSKNSFRPPPKVESAVVRMEPLSNPPPVDFQDWDNFMKVCFCRRNKVLKGLFCNKKTLQSLYKNYKDIAAMRGNEEPSFDDFKAVVQDILGKRAPGALKGAEEEWGRQRSSKITLERFLALYSAFLEKDIRFL